MAFRDGESRIRKKNSAINMTIIKHMAINLINLGKGKKSTRLARKSAIMNNAFLREMVTKI